MDPGPDFVFGRDEFDREILAGLSNLGEPAEHLSSLANYLDLVKVSLPEWVLEHDHHGFGQNHHLGHHSHQHHQKKKMHSMAKQFGSLGKKFRKNLAKISQTVGGGGGYRHRSGHDTVDSHQRPARYVIRSKF